MEIGKVDQHARLQDNGLLGCHNVCLAFDNTECCRHTGVEAVDLHDDCVEIWHVGGHCCEAHLVDRLDLGEELGENIWALL